MPYGEFSTWDSSDDGSGAAYVGQDEPSAPRRRGGGFLEPRTNAVNRLPAGLQQPTLLGNEQAVANANSRYLNSTLPMAKERLANFNTNFFAGVGGNNSSSPHWMKNSLGGYQTAPDATHPAMSMGPMDNQLLTKQPGTGLPWPAVNRDLTQKDYEMYGAGSDYGFNRGGPQY